MSGGGTWSTCHFLLNINMEKFKEFYSSRIGISRAGDYIYVLPQAIEEFDQRTGSDGRFLSKFKIPFAWVKGANDDSALIYNVNVSNENGKRRIYRPSTKPTWNGSGSIVRKYTFKLTDEERRDIDTFLKNFNS